MARERDNDEYDDEPRRGKRDRDDDDYDDRPRRSSGGEMGPLDKMFRDTNIVVLILFGFCCAIISFPLSLVAYITGKNEKAKSHAMIVLAISGVIIAINFVYYFAVGFGAAAGRVGR